MVMVCTGVCTLAFKITFLKENVGTKIMNQLKLNINEKPTGKFPISSVLIFLL